MKHREVRSLANQVIFLNQDALDAERRFEGTGDRRFLELAREAWDEAACLSAHVFGNVTQAH